MAPPSPFHETTGAIADLKVGQSVSVTANENIAIKESFDAALFQITIISPSLPAQQPSSRIW